MKIAGDSQFMFECLLSLRVVVCRILRWLPRLPSLGISALHSPGPMNMMDFTIVTSICYMARFTVRKGDSREPNLIVGVI